jgi:hypothetical protein
MPQKLSPLHVIVHNLNFLTFLLKYHLLKEINSLLILVHSALPPFSMLISCYELLISLISFFQLMCVLSNHLLHLCLQGRT